MIKHLQKGTDYLGYGGQGLIMSLDQFVQFIKYNNYKYRDNNNNNAISNFNEIPKPENCVVKIISCTIAWLSELSELTQAKEDLNLTYVDPYKMGGHFYTDEYVGRCTYGDGFVTFSLNIQKFSVIFMKRLEPVEKNTSSKGEGENKEIWDKVIKPLMIQLATYHKLGKVHRDIKEMNIMKDGKNATLIDFGMARTIDVMKADPVRNLAGTSYYISCWYEMLNAMSVETRTKRLDTRGWPYKFMTSTINYQNGRRHRIINKRTFFIALCEANMINYILNTHGMKDIGSNESIVRQQDIIVRQRDIIKEHVGTFMKMNDWYTLALTIQELYDVQLPALPDGYDTQGIITKCYRPPNEKEVLCHNIKHVLSETKWPKGNAWKDILDSIINIKTKKEESIYLGGTAKKGIYKVLGRERKAYKKKGGGNVLYVKVKGQEMTLKEARNKEKKEKKISKPKGTQKRSIN